MGKLAPPNHVDQFKKMFEDADRKFCEAYRKESYENWDGEGFNVRQECQNYAELAIKNMAKGNMYRAFKNAESANALEGDFCGWVDLRMYTEPKEVFDWPVEAVKEISLKISDKNENLIVFTFRDFKETAEEWLQKSQIESKISALRLKNDEELCRIIEAAWEVESSPPLWFQVYPKNDQRGPLYRILFTDNEI